MKKWFIIILVLAATCSVLLVWLAFHPNLISSVFRSENRLLVILALLFCLLPIYFASREVKKGTPLFQGPILIIGLMIYALVLISAEFLFHATWVYAALHWAHLLFFFGFLAVIWNRYMHRSN